MAKTQDYLDYLNEQIAIAPANSQEELQAARTISDLFDSHGLEPTIQEFDTPSSSRTSLGILLCLMFFGVLLAGLGSTVLSVIGILLALAATILLAMRYFGKDVLAAYGPTSKSQNVLAFHEGTGELAAKGNRPIIVVAHYDTPRVDFLWSPALAPYMAMLKQACVALVPIVAVIALVQAFGFVPELGRKAVWVIGLVASLPLLLWGVSILAKRFMGCTPGANNNKSGVAAMLGVLAKVRPSTDDGVSASTRGQRPPAEEDASEGYEDEGEQDGVRHGKEVLETLHILPETCEINYVIAQENDSTGVLDRQAIDEGPENEAEDGISDETHPMEPTELSSEDEQSTSEAMPLPEHEVERPSAENPITHHPMPDIPSINLDDDNATDPGATRIAAPSIPRSKVPAAAPATPRRSDPARRASLFDLPDPAQAEVDPFDATMGTDPVETEHTMGETVRIDTEDVAPLTPSQDEIGHITTEDLDFSEQHKRRGFFGRHKKKQKKDDQSMSDWLGVEDDYDVKKDGAEPGHDPDRGWKGGATTNGRFRVIEGTMPEEPEVVEPLPSDDDFNSGEAGVWESETPDANDLREAVLSMGDDELISHDIWFVALGASGLGHAGMDAFLAEYRRALRGAFLFNLDCIGAGELTVLSQEGLAGRRRADRRLLRLLKETASDIHVDLNEGEQLWGDTDATPAMRTSLRSVTIVGLDANKLPALAHSMDDIVDQLNYQQVEDVADLVTETIRRS